MKRNKMADVVLIVTATHIAIIFLLAFFGNLTTIIVIATYRELKNTTHYYILNLAISDFLMCISTTATRLFFIFDNNFLICKISAFTSTFFGCSSVFAIFFITYDRYIFICKPLYYRMHSVSTRNILWISIAWIVAFIISILPYTYVPYIRLAPSVGRDDYCNYRYVLSDHYITFLVISTEFLPPFVLCLMYSRIYFVARKHAIEIAIQFRNTKYFSMDWLERRRFTETLMSPFQNPISLLARPGAAENDQAKQIRQVLFNNYNTWKQQRQEELKKISELHKNKDADVFDAPTQDEDLSKVGKSLRNWKRRATSSSSEPLILEDWIPEDRKVIEVESSKNRLRHNKVAPFQNDEVTNKERSLRITEPGKVQQNRPGLRKYLPIATFNSINRNKVSRERNHGEGDSVHRDQGIGESNRIARATIRTRANLFVEESLSKVIFWKRKDNTREVKTKKDFKAVRMIGLVLGMFILLHIPTGIIDMIGATAKNIRTPSWIRQVGLCLAYSSPAVNPMIYVIIKRQFRYAFVKLWSCGRIKRRLSEATDF